MTPRPEGRALHPGVLQLVPVDLFDAKELERFAQPDSKPGFEPTELLEKLSPCRPALFPDHT